MPAERLPHRFRKFSRLDGEDGWARLRGVGPGPRHLQGIGGSPRGPRMAGRAWARGSPLRFRWSKRPGLTPQPDPLSSLPARGGAEREQARILVVDDDPQALRYVRDALSKRAIPIVTGDPEEVSRLMETNKPHLVLLDLILPGSDGI